MSGNRHDREHCWNCRIAGGWRCPGRTEQGHGCGG